MGIKMSQKIPWCYEEAEVHRSAIIQDFRDHEKKIFVTAKFVIGYP